MLYSKCQKQQKEMQQVMEWQNVFIDDQYSYD